VVAAAADALPPVPATPTKRPASVSIVTFLAIVVAGYSFFEAGRTLREAGSDDTRELLDGAMQIGLGVLALAIAYGAFRMRPWAWKLFMVWAVVGLTTQLLRYFSFGDPEYVRLAVSAFVVFALTPRDVQVAFGIRPPPNAQLARTTRNPLDRD
jgi:hypothetical protein